jgi:hypothetical protein
MAPGRQGSVDQTKHPLRPSTHMDRSDRLLSSKVLLSRGSELPHSLFRQIRLPVLILTRHIHLAKIRLDLSLQLQVLNIQELGIRLRGLQYHLVWAHTPEPSPLHLLLIVLLLAEFLHRTIRLKPIVSRLQLHNPQLVQLRTTTTAVARREVRVSSIHLVLICAR